MSAGISHLIGFVFRKTGQESPVFVQLTMQKKQAESPLVGAFQQLQEGGLELIATKEQTKEQLLEQVEENKISKLNVNIDITRVENLEIEIQITILCARSMRAARI